ncbi:MAG TPA: Ldh family oxidoreductase [Usitatibacter sp.]|nr:Ldh family oxidoreductase [Usitatibacter sp.]
MSIRIAHAELEQRVLDALFKNGFAAEVAAPIARTVAACERDGTLSHGLLRLPGYIEAVRSGWADGKAAPEVLSKSPSMIVADARNGFTHLALSRERARLMEMARTTGSAILLIRNAHHFAALWPDIEDFAVEGFIAMACVTSRARVVGWGGGKPVFGTNASAFACPRAGGAPIVWDQAASVMSQGEILVAARAGRSLPEGIGVDALGQPTTDPKAVLEGGALVPFGGVKGASIAFTVEVLAAALTGSPFGFESPANGTLPSKGGEFVMVIDPRLAQADVGARVESLVEAVFAAGSEHLPGSRRYARRAKALAEGIALDAHSLEILGRLSSNPLQP